MKYGLVLSGGGAKGAYEAGCIKALKELGYEFDIVTGTSIGALNGLLVAQHDYDKLYHLWDTLSLDQLLTDHIKFDFLIESMLQQSNLMMSFYKSYINKKGADITPLKNLIHSLYDGKKAKNSSTKYGLVTVTFPQLKPIEITVDQMNDTNIVEYAIASASCFPAFPIHEIDQQGYIDGGYFDNLPISLALDMGAKSIIAIELNQEATHEYLLHRPGIKVIRPSLPLGGFLDFDRTLLDFRICLGYYDTLKAFNKLKGYRYTFKNEKVPHNICQTFYHKVLNYENQLNHTILNRAIGNDSIPLTQLLKADTYLDQIQLDDYFILGLEITMDYLSYQHDTIYEFDNVIQEVKKHFKINEDDRLLFKQLGQNLKDLTSKQSLSYFLSNPDNLPNIIPSLFTKEFLIALFVQSLY